MQKIQGIMTAIVTPLQPDGAVNEAQLRALIQQQLAAGVHNLVVIGGTGEYCALPEETRQEAVRIAVAEVAGRVPVVVGCLEPGLGQATRFLRFCKEAGADALLVLTPYYVIATQDGIYAYFKALTQAVDIPVIIYNIPGRTGVNVQAATVERLVQDCPGIIGVKDCSNSLTETAELQRRVGARVSVICGEDFLIPYAFALGVPAAMVASGNLIPEVWVRIYDLYREGRQEDGLQLFLQHFTFLKALFRETCPSLVKYGLALLGQPCGQACLPITAPSAESRQLLEAEMRKLSLLPA